MTTNVPTIPAWSLAPREKAVLTALGGFRYASTISDISAKSGYSISNTETALANLEQRYRMVYQTTMPDVRPIRYRLTAEGIIQLRFSRNGPQR